MTVKYDIDDEEYLEIKQGRYYRCDKATGHRVDAWYLKAVRGGVTDMVEAIRAVKTNDTTVT